MFIILVYMACMVCIYYSYIEYVLYIYIYTHLYLYTHILERENLSYGAYEYPCWGSVLTKSITLQKYCGARKQARASLHSVSHWLVQVVENKQLSKHSYFLGSIHMNVL